MFTCLYVYVCKCMLTRNESMNQRMISSPEVPGRASSSSWPQWPSRPRRSERLQSGALEVLFKVRAAKLYPKVEASYAPHWRSWPSEAVQPEAAKHSCLQPLAAPPPTSAPTGEFVLQVHLDRQLVVPPDRGEHVDSWGCFRSEGLRFGCRLNVCHALPCVYRLCPIASQCLA